MELKVTENEVIVSISSDNEELSMTCIMSEVQVLKFLADNFENLKSGISIEISSIEDIDVKLDKDNIIDIYDTEGLLH